MSFTTRISRVAPGRLTIRGYRIEDIIAGASAGDAFFLLFSGRRATEQEARVFDAVLACCVEHGFVNTAAVAGRYVMSGSGFLPAAMAAGILSFGQHTGTAHLTAMMLAEIGNGSPLSVTDETLDGYVAEMRARRRAIPGFGHPLHKDSDPREVALRDVATKVGLHSPNTELLDRLAAAIARRMGRKLVLNVDGLIGSLLMDMGLDPDAIFAVNIVGAMPGIAAHAIEEHAQGNRLRVPAEADTNYERIDERSW